jgi:hypothetical protein
MPVAQLCTAHSDCLQRSTRTCSAVHTLHPGGNGPLIPCRSMVCERTNHRFCDVHCPQQCRSRNCDQPAMWPQDIERIPRLEPDGGAPRPELAGNCSRECTPGEQRRSREQWLASCRRIMRREEFDEVTYPSISISHHPASDRCCLSGSGGSRGLTSPNGKRGTGKCVGTQAKSSPTLASTWLKLVTASACIISAEGAKVMSPMGSTILNPIASYGHHSQIISASIRAIAPILSLCLLAVTIVRACQHTVTPATSNSPTTPMSEGAFRTKKTPDTPSPVLNNSKHNKGSTKGSKNRSLTWVQPGHRSHALAVCI